MYENGWNTIKGQDFGANDLPHPNNDEEEKEDNRFENPVVNLLILPNSSVIGDSASGFNPLSLTMLAGDALINRTCGPGNQGPLRINTGGHHPRLGATAKKGILR